MKEIDDEIKLTINTMQCDIDDGAHGELQSHLYGLLEIKRNELQQRLVDRSWLDHADGMGSVVTHDQAPYKSVKIEGQIADGDKPLTADELRAGGWWCADISEECRLVFVSKGINSWSESWVREKPFERCYLDSAFVMRSSNASGGFKQIHRIGNEFYWGEA